jgi:hypothetical protein
MAIDMLEKQEYQPEPDQLSLADTQEQSMSQPESEGTPAQGERKHGRPRVEIPPEDEKRQQIRRWNDNFYQNHRERKLDASKRYQKTHKEERAKYLREYRKRRRDQHEAELNQGQLDQHTDPIQVFPTPTQKA